ncbi:MAG: hypothetical protein POELPBGB_03923 [Bacteroidia bacterium]|nr:hypothetical protein [Bacteroidia bacterium]
MMFVIYKKTETKNTVNTNLNKELYGLKCANKSCDGFDKSQRGKLGLFDWQSEKTPQGYKISGLTLLKETCCEDYKEKLLDLFEKVLDDGIKSEL